ncbi:hypothetical protein QYM36_009018 [Artemia franciscana]|nr:hypothetical protein QYM36_009018 [Artemia franciscana]
MGLSWKARAAGPEDESGRCDTCKQDWLMCVGHFGHIDLVRPVFHIGFMSHILGILNMICKECARILFDSIYVEKIRLRLRRKEGMTFVEQKALFKKMVADGKKISRCRHCSANNGVLKNVARFKITYEPFRNAKEDDPEFLKFKEEQDEAMSKNRWLEAFQGEYVKFINPQMCLNLFEKISEDDASILMLRQAKNEKSLNYPVDLILTRLPVAPSCIRPTVQSDLKDSTNEDDITVVIRNIVIVNETLLEGLRNGSLSSSKMQETWDILQMKVALLFDGDPRYIPQDVERQSYRGFVQRLKGKQGRFRQNLEGKRCNFTARSVISPDPNLKIDQVGVPRLIAQTLTFPEKVTPANIEWLKKLVINGSKHPGANSVLPSSPEVKRYNLGFLDENKRKLYASKLRNGDTVYRHLHDDDIVLFNRQPSLHRMSIMSHRVKVLEGRTLRFNECACTPYNADFDGDEMNLHFPQTQEARTEAATLMDIKQNLITPRNGEILVALTQDFITGAYLLSRKDCFLDKNKAQQLMAQILVHEDASLKFEMPVPAILKPAKLWTGKQIISFIFKHYQNEGVEGGKVKINLRAPGKLYERDKRLLEMDPSDSYLIIRNSDIISGTLEKNTVGTGSRVNVFLEMTRLYNSTVATKAMWRIARVASYYLMTTGFSIGIGDVTPSERLLRRKEKLLRTGFDRCDEILRSLAIGTLEVMPGRTADETAEGDILQTLSRIRDDLGKECIKELPRNNAPLIMALSGSKGSNINIAQMVVCVGQQALNGKRVPNGFDERSLPHFKKKSKEPDSRGFVSASFYSGLKPPEFVFHAMAGREGLVDTAVKTAETGYIQRRLMKCLEDIVTEYDGSVRTSSSDLIQIRYGGDGFDPVMMETETFPIDLEKAIERSCLLISDLHGKKLKEEEVIEVANRRMSLPDYDILDVYSKDWDVGGAKRRNEEKRPKPRETSRVPLVKVQFKNYILDYLRSKCNNIESSWKALGLNPDNQELWKPSHKSLEGVTEKQLMNFLECIPDLFQKSLMKPGEPVGAICGQSIGEPATQMTLKTFHFAGVASMNISQGVPRLQEIMNNAKNIATPLITAKLSDPYDERAARRAKALLEKTTLGQIALEVDYRQSRDGACVRVKIDINRVRLLQLHCNIYSIAESIRNSKILKSAKLEVADPVSIEDNTIEIDISHTKLRGGPEAAASVLRSNLAAIPISGIPQVRRCVISKEGGKMELLIEGLGMREVLGTPGVNGLASTSNHIDEVYKCLGIEASHTMIVQEITNTVKGHGITIDRRHIELLAANMTCTGVVEGTTRYGLQKMRNSVFLLSSFEQTSKHLYDAAFFGVTDDLSGVSENIIFGTNVPLGTNKFDILCKPDQFKLDKAYLCESFN